MLSIRLELLQNFRLHVRSHHYASYLVSSKPCAEQAEYWDPAGQVNKLITRCSEIFLVLEYFRFYTTVCEHIYADVYHASSL
jgi:hypothetical protein